MPERELTEVTGGTLVDATSPDDATVVRPLTTLASALAVLATMNGPSIYLANHVLHQPFGLDDWHYTYPVQAVGVLGVVWLVRPPRHSRALRPWWPGALVGAFAAWILLSAWWSEIPSVTAQRAMLTAGVLAFAVAFALRPVAEQVVSITLAANAAALASAIVIVFQPSVGRSVIDAAGRGDHFQGIFANRNSLGPVCSLALIGLAGCVLLYRDRRVVAAAVVGAVLNVWLLVGARSATALIGVVAAAVVLVAALVAQRWATTAGERRVRTTSFAVLGVVVVGAVLFRSRLLDVVGRDGGLSDRDVIWGDVLDIVARRPALGHGFWVFWDTEARWELYNQQGGYQFGNAHNSLLEAALGLGWIGAGLLLAIVVAAVVGTITWNSMARTPLAAWWCALLAFVVLEHVTESFLLYHSYLLLLLAAAAVVPWVRRTGTTPPATPAVSLTP